MARKGDKYDELRQAIAAIFGGEQAVRVIIARDHEARLKVIEAVTVWENPEKEGKKVTDLKKNFEFSTSILGLPKKNSKGVWMIPILWQRRKCWVGWKSLEELPSIHWAD